MPNTLTAKKILETNNVGDIFTNDKSKIKSEYISLCKIWHPDTNSSPESDKVMMHINLLYQKALELIEQNKWEGTNFTRLSGKNKKAYEFKYYATYSFELGTMYISDSYVAYLLNEDHKDLYTNALTQINNLKYSSDNMKEEMQKYLPSILDKFETVDNQFGLVIKKTPDLLLLQDVLNYFKAIDDKHVAWIMSSLYNLTCYFDYNHIAHNGITLSNCFISPEYHSVCILGGWWYSKNQGDKMIGVSRDIFNILPPKTKEFKISNITTDLESIRLLSKKILSNSTTVPQSFLNWLKIGSSEKAKDEYKKWFEVLNSSYGKRKFVMMDLKRSDLYK